MDDPEPETPSESPTSPSWELWGSRSRRLIARTSEFTDPHEAAAVLEELALTQLPECERDPAVEAAAALGQPTPVSVGTLAKTWGCRSVNYDVG